MVLHRNGSLDSDCVDLVRRLARDQVNKGYAWLEANPVTGLLVAGGLSGIAVLGVLGLSIYSQKTFVAKSACTKDPASAACAAIREDVARAEPIRNPCIAHQRVTRTRGRACPKDYIDLRRSGSTGAARVREAGDVGPVPTAGGGTGGGMGANQGPHGGGGGTKQPPKPDGPASAPESAPGPVGGGAPAGSQPESPAGTPSQPNPEPGNSGNGASAEHGLDLCVELAVSACVKSGFDVPVQLP